MHGRLISELYAVCSHAVALAPCNCIPVKDRRARWVMGRWLHKREDS